MKKKVLFLLVSLISLALLGGVVYAAGKKGGKRAMKKADNVLYVCDCGDDCKCDTVSKKPGKCTCGTKLAPMHVLKIEGDEAILCRCGKNCQCEMDPNDDAKCGCGKPVKRVNIKGMYVCGCGEECKCNSISDKPGKCKCGKDMKKVEEKKAEEKKPEEKKAE